MARPQLRQRIEDFVCGDDLLIERTITQIPSGVTVTKAYFTVKGDPEDLDASAIFQLSITTTLTSQGQITATGSTGVATLQLLVSDTQSLLLTPGDIYYFDVQLIMSDGGIHTPFKGTMQGVQQITISTT